jgi:hypothetical protein
MGKEWDKFTDSEKLQAFTKEWATEALRVAKPGAFMFCFGGTRTSHRIACGIEDAGWEIRDTIMYVYGSGFPKSYNISKGIDKDNGKKVSLYAFTRWFSEASAGKTNKEIDEYLGLDSNGATASHYRCVTGQQPRFPRLEYYYKLKEWIGFGDEWDEVIEEAEREVVGKNITNKTVYQAIGETNISGEVDITAPATDQAKLWDGWGTALKPAFEPIIVCMKPRDGTFVENALKHGVAGLNIDGGRVTTSPNENFHRPVNATGIHEGYDRPWRHTQVGQRRNRASRDLSEQKAKEQGRWPANIIHDGSEEVLAGFPQAGASGKASGKTLGKMGTHGIYGKANGVDDTPFYGDSGSTARFFYCAKASKAERNAGDIENRHPTVKPLSLMVYLARLTQTPTGGVVLDPFMGSGTTGMACKKVGRDFIGIELDEHYFEIAEKRIASVVQQELI